MVAANQIRQIEGGMSIRFGEWLPDMPADENPGLLVARNCIPKAIGYQSFGSFVKTSFEEIPERPRGGISVLRQDDSVFNYAATVSGIYLFQSTAFVDVSKPGGYSLIGSEQWDMVQWRQTVVATCIDEPVQSIDIGGSNFSDLITSANKPSARYAAVLRNQWLVLGNTRDATNGDQPTWLQFSARNDPTDFDPDPAKFSKIEPLDADSGEILELISGEFLTVICRKSIYRVTFVGGTDIFRVDRVVRNRGAICAGSVVDFNRRTYFFDEDGPYVFDGVEARSFGNEKFNSTVRSSLINWDYRAWISSAVDYVNQGIVWALPVSRDTPEFLLFYNWKTDRATVIERNCQRVFAAYSQDLFTDDPTYGDLNIDQLPQALWNIDGTEFTGGKSGLGAFCDNNFGFFSGPAIPATFEIGRFRPFAPYRAIVNGSRVLLEGGGGTETVSIGMQEQPKDPVAWGPALPVNEAGSINNLAQGRYVRARVQVGDHFDYLTGLDVMMEKDSIR